MYEVKRSEDDRLDVLIRGKLEADEMKELLDALEKQSTGIEDGRLFLDMEDFHLPTLAAMKVELSRMPAMIGFIRRFSRAAVLSETGWVNAASSMEGLLIPGLELRSFRRDQRYHAESWIEPETISEVHK